MIQTTISSSDYQLILTIDVYPLRIDWFRIAADIKKTSGLSYAKQALALDKQQSTLEHWINGGQPRFSDGHALLILHSKLCGVELTKNRLDEAVPSNNFPASKMR